MSLTICSVVGARPQFIKAAPVSIALRARGLNEVLVHTGQHYDHNMSDVFWQELGLPPAAVNLACGSGRHGAQTGRMLEALEQTFESVAPDWVLVYGDTNSTIAGALAAAKLRIPVAHVEAGLRSFNRRMPEEINRIATDAISDLLLAPTELARQNLEHEGVPACRVVTTGDVMFDAMLRLSDLARARPAGPAPVGDARPYILATVHRAENTDDADRLMAIVSAFGIVARDYPVVWPVHPRTRQRLREFAMRVPPGLHLIDPLGPIDMCRITRNAALVATDSGGLQKEAFFLEVPCATLRHETEWRELVDAGWNRLVPPTGAAEVAAGLRAALGTRGQPVTPYGRGDAALKVVAAISARSGAR